MFFLASDVSIQDLLTYIFLALAFLYFRRTVEKKSTEGKKSHEERKKIKVKKEHSSPPYSPLPSQSKSVKSKEIRSRQETLEETYYLESNLSSRRLASSLENRVLPGKLSQINEPLFSYDDVHLKRLPARGRLAITRLSRPYDIVIYKEILDKPKGLR